jgi:hypothetical protein
MLVRQLGIVVERPRRHHQVAGDEPAWPLVKLSSCAHMRVELVAANVLVDRRSERRSGRSFVGSRA